MFDFDKIPEYFPHQEFRSGQKECIEATLKAFQKGKRYVIIEAPTGSGKSAIGITLSRFFNDSYYLTIQKILQDQLTRDFVDTEIKSLKGRNAYDCDYWAKYKTSYSHNPNKMKIMDRMARDPRIKATMTARRLPCSEGVCLVKDQISKCSLCFPTKDTTTCNYYQALWDAQASRTCIMNFHSFLFQTSVANRFHKRELMIIDEGHNSEPQLMSFVSLSITDRSFRSDEKIRFPKLETAEQYAQYFHEIELHELINEKIRVNRYAGNIKETDNWKKTLLQYQIFLDSVDSGNWIPKFEEKKTHNKVTLKPIFVDKHANNYLFDKADKIVMMSATILNPKIIYESLGINPSEAYAYRMKNRFPLKNRPIYYTPCGSMSYKNKQKTKPELLKSVEEICATYKNQKGIIHTHNFEIANYIIENCSQELKHRLLFQGHFISKDEMLLEHEHSQDTIIIAPAMHEGLDLKNDLSRFQIICKMPFPSLGNNDQLRARMEVSPHYYDWLSALKLVQSIGRSIRSEEDWADTYILDSDFSFFRKKANKQLPSWFKEAIKS